MSYIPVFALLGFNPNCSNISPMKMLNRSLLAIEKYSLNSLIYLICVWDMSHYCAKWSTDTFLSTAYYGQADLLRFSLIKCLILFIFCIQSFA